ncbi:hypothetical protein P43SY_004987 [Pythium insidiosum]|uniref:CR-type domain-containing protein n=1 Tax=Pythium insidiosum TaxID=114742 RepID=A0AAD5Q9R6_PYTIN|nr:hypothetical protein P43SY_004987 [Pythium insidiosum]
MRWYAVEPSLPEKAVLRIRAAPSSDADIRGSIAKGRVIAALSPEFEIEQPDGTSPPQRWLHVTFQDDDTREYVEGYVMAALPDGSNPCLELSTQLSVCLNNCQISELDNVGWRGLQALSNTSPIIFWLLALILGGGAFEEPPAVNAYQAAPPPPPTLQVRTRALSSDASAARAAGFIGFHTAKALLERGDDVVVLDEMNDYYDVRLKQANLDFLVATYTSERVKVYVGDICDQALVRKVIRDTRPEAMIHLAARAGVRPSIMDPLIYIHSNVTATTVLLEACRRYGIKKFVYASSSSVYGGSTKASFSEEDIVDCPVSPYAATKKSCELIAHTYHHLHKMDCIGLRFFTVYGPRGRPDMAPFKFMDRIARGLPIDQYGDGSSSRDYTFIDDIVQGVLLSLDKAQGCEVFNLGNGSPILLTDFIRIIERLVGKKAIINVLPNQPGDVPRTCANVSKAQRLLGYKPTTPLEQGLKKTWEWYSSFYANPKSTPREKAAVNSPDDSSATAAVHSLNSSASDARRRRGKMAGSNATDDHATALDDDDDDGEMEHGGDEEGADDCVTIVVMAVVLLAVGGLIFLLYNGLVSEANHVSRRFHDGVDKVNAKHVHVPVTLEQLYSGFSTTVDVDRQLVCRQCAGSGVDLHAGFHTCHECKGTGVRTFLQQIGPIQQHVRSTCNVCHGRGQVANEKCGTCKGRGLLRDRAELRVDVERGMQHGDTIVLERHGDQAARKAPGDVVQQTPHASFTRRGDDLELTLEISLVDALVGFTRRVEHLDKRVVTLQRHDVVAPDTLWRIPREGMPVRGRRGAFGDLLVRFVIAYPTEPLTPQQQAAVQELLA